MGNILTSLIIWYPSLWTICWSYKFRGSAGGSREGEHMCGYLRGGVCVWGGSPLEWAWRQQQQQNDNQKVFCVCEEETVILEVDKNKKWKKKKK